MTETTEQIKDVATDELVGIRAEVNRIAREEAISISALAREADIPVATFSGWLNGKYAGNNERIGAQAQRWLTARAEKRAAQAAQPITPGFIETPSARAHFQLLQHAQYAVDFCLDTGVPGIGKTTSARRYLEVTPHVFMITAQPSMTTVPGLLVEIAEALGIDYSASTQRLSQRIIRRLRGSQSLLIVDEAQHLVVIQIEMLRSIHDLAEVGVVLIGNETVFSRIDGAGRTTNYAQLFSRVGLRKHRIRVQPKDVELILDAWGIEDGATRRYAMSVAAKPGALRQLTKVLRYATMAARLDVADAKPRVEHLKSAYAALSGGAAVGEAA